jgi:hypothetical protein
MYWGYISRAIDRLVACLNGLDEDELNWRPLESANSLYVLATHMLGNLEENILGIMSGQPIHRDRDAEFTMQAFSADPVQKRWGELKERIGIGLAKLPAIALEREYKHPRRGALTGREVLLVVARHSTEHLGHAELTRDLLKAEAPRENVTIELLSEQ